MAQLDQYEVAIKYAKAFLLVHGTTLSLVDISHVWSLVHFLKEYRVFLFYLSLNSVSSSDKAIFLEKITLHFSLHNSFRELFLLLIQRKQIFLLHDVLLHLYRLYKVQHGIADLQIFTPIILSDEKIAQLCAFFEKQSNQKVVACQHLDESLIAGVRLQSDLYMWEESIAKQLRVLRQKFIV